MYPVDVYTVFFSLASVSVAKTSRAGFASYFGAKLSGGYMWGCVLLMGRVLGLV